jgi:hypothetical protein
MKSVLVFSILFWSTIHSFSQIFYFKPELGTMLSTERPSLSSETPLQDVFVAIKDASSKAWIVKGNFMNSFALKLGVKISKKNSFETGFGRLMMATAMSMEVNDYGSSTKDGRILEYRITDHFPMNIIPLHFIHETKFTLKMNQEHDVMISYELGLNYFLGSEGGYYSAEWLQNTGANPEISIYRLGRINKKPNLNSSLIYSGGIAFRFNHQQKEALSFSINYYFGSMPISRLVATRIAIPDREYTILSGTKGLAFIFSRSFDIHFKRK